MKRGKSSLVWAWKLFAELVTIVWLLALWDSYRPKVTITPGVTLNPKSPFGTIFIIQNQGSLPIANIRYITHLTLVPPRGATNSFQFVTHEQNVSVIPQMKALESYSLSIHYPQVQMVPRHSEPSHSEPSNQPTNQAKGAEMVMVGGILISFDVSYEPKFFGKRTDTLYFTGTTDVDGNWQWLPTAHQSMLEQIIDTNLIQKLPVAALTNDGAKVHTNQAKPH